MPENIPQPEPEIIIDSLETLKIFFDPLRSQIVRTIANEPRSVQEIADKLGIPFTRLYYHINMLEKHGIIRLVDVRNIGGAVEEKYYQVAARSFVIDRKWLTLSDPDESESGLEAIMTTMLDGTKDDIRRSVQSGRIDMSTTAPDPKSVVIRRGIARMSEEHARQFYERVLELMQEFSVAHDENEDSVYYALALALYPSQLPYDEPQDEDETEEDA